MSNFEAITKKCLMFLLLWFAYGSCYLLRKPFGIIKNDMQETMHISENSLGYIDLFFSLPYALCSIVFGFVGDRFQPRLILGCGLLGTGISSSVMGRIDKLYEMFILLFISGSFQAICWPAVCSILSSWFSHKNRSSIMAVYSSCMLVGSILGSFLTIYLQSVSNWRNVFGIPSLAVVIIGILVLLCARSKNKDKDDENLLPELELGKFQNKGNSPMGIWHVLSIPTIPEASIALLFIKGLRTAMMFWLPLYLMRVLNFNTLQSGLIPLSFEIGGLIGSIAIIFVCTKIFKLSDLLVCTAASLLCGIVFLMFFLLPRFGVVYLHIMLFLSGAFSNVVEIILCGSFPSKIGEKINEKSSVVGVVNGIGSLGIVIEGPTVSVMSFYLGLKFFLPLLSVASFLAFIFTLKSYYTYRMHRENV